MRKNDKQDHPRLCGEKKRQAETEVLQPGSPPPMRGKVLDLLEDLCAVGITPAYAGKSTVGYEESIAYRDHPRLCGEKKAYVSVVECTQGSPPPMRGKVPRLCRKWTHGGITPAYAGKSTIKICLTLWKTGSPPPMRGKVAVATKEDPPDRITPAYAGKSPGHTNITSTYGDHPRLCGEKASSADF